MMRMHQTGESWYQSGAANQFVFTSYSRDSESGLDYALARYYDSRTGTFCSADPLAGSPDDPQSWNRYAYARNNPILNVDPSGKGWLSWVLDIGIGIGAAFLPELAPAWFSAGSSIFGATQGFVFSADGSFIGASAGAVSTWGSSTLASVTGGALAGATAASATNPPQAPQNPASPPKKNCDVSAKSIDQYIKKAKPSSPLVGQGDKFMATGLKYNLDPRLLVSLSGVETTFGTAITRGHYNALNVLYNGRHSDFSSFGSNINSAGKSITNPANQYDLSNTSSMYQKYCSGAQCSTALKNLNTMMGQQGAKTNALHYPCP